MIDGILGLELAGIYWARFWGLSWRGYTGRDFGVGAGGDILGGFLGFELAEIYNPETKSKQTNSSTKPGS